LELGLCLLARDLFLPELLLHRGERGGLVCQASPRPLRLLGPLFGLALPSARSLEGRTVLMELGPNRGQLAPPTPPPGFAPLPDPPAEDQERPSGRWMTAP
jgi:hypothetical protein